MSSNFTGTKGRWLPRVAAALAAGASVLALTTGPAAAQTCYPPGSPECSTTTTTAPQTITVSDETLVAGQSFRVRVGGFRAGETVTFTIDGQVIGTGVADAQGFVDVMLTLPAGIDPGQQTILASGTGADGQPLVVTRVVTVTGVPIATANPQAVNNPGGTTSSTPRSGGSLARTGLFVVPITAGGLALVATGAVLSRSARKRKAVAA